VSEIIDIGFIRQLQEQLNSQLMFEMSQELKTGVSFQCEEVKSMSKDDLKHHLNNGKKFNAIQCKCGHNQSFKLVVSDSVSKGFEKLFLGLPMDQNINGESGTYVEEFMAARIARKNYEFWKTQKNKINLLDPIFVWGQLIVTSNESIVCQVKMNVESTALGDLFLVYPVVFFNESEFKQNEV